MLAFPRTWLGALHLTIDGSAVLDEEVLVGEAVLPRALAREDRSGGAGETRAGQCLCRDGAARGPGPTPVTRRQHAAIYRSFGEWLRGRLGRPPVVSDLDGDAIAAYAQPPRDPRQSRRPTHCLGHRLRPPLNGQEARREIGSDDVDGSVRVPRHRRGQPRPAPTSVRESLARAGPPLTGGQERFRPACASSATAGCAPPSSAALRPRPALPAHRRLYVRGEGEHPNARSRSSRRRSGRLEGVACSASARPRPRRFARRTTVVRAVGQHHRVERGSAQSADLDDADACAGPLMSSVGGRRPSTSPRR